MAFRPAVLTQLLQALLDIVLPPICHVCHELAPHVGILHVCPDCHDRLPHVSPPFCPVCGIPFAAGSGINHPCGACLTAPPHFDTAWANFIYEGAIRDLIHAYKYDRRMHLRRPLALLVLEGINHVLTHDPHLIVPVPLHRSRLRQRGFNQAVLIGTVLSRYTSLPLSPDALTRIRPTEPQITLAASERHSNVKGAFSVKRPELVSGKRILLLDDVMTTGSTMNECAKELKAAGAERVIALSIARTAR